MMKYQEYIRLLEAKTHIHNAICHLKALWFTTQNEELEEIWNRLEERLDIIERIIREAKP